MLVRLALLSISQLHFHAFAKKVAELYGVAAANFFLLFTTTQFHLQFYLSRTLPNFVALPVVVLGLAELLAADVPPKTAEYSTKRLLLGINFLLCAGIIARSEIASLCGLIILVDLLLSPSPKKYILTILPVIILSVVVSTSATIIIDTQLWSVPSFPELEALRFNVIGGHASEWGVEPWNYYVLSLPKLFLNPMVPILIASTIVITWNTSISFLDALRRLRYILIVPILYVLGFSFLAHKEWRFIVYIVPLLTTASSISAAYIHHHRTRSLFYRLIHVILLLSILGSLVISIAMGIVSSTNYPGGMALDSLHTICNSSNARVYLDVPTRMTGATLPLCIRNEWTYMKSENTTLLHSIEYWKDVDYAIVGHLADVPCKRGKGVEGKGEWEVIYRQQGYSGIVWKPFQIPDTMRNNTYVNDLRSNEQVRKIAEEIEDVINKVMDFGRTNLNKVTSNERFSKTMEKGKKIAGDISEALQKNQYVNKAVSNNPMRGMLSRFEEGWNTFEGLKVPCVKLEDKIFVLKHMRKEHILERNRILEEKKAKERQGLGKQGEVEGQWRDFY